jgi:hypothetical protein
MTRADGMARADGITQADGIAQADGITRADGMTQADGITRADGMTQADGITRADGITLNPAIRGADVAQGRRDAKRCALVHTHPVGECLLVGIYFFFAPLRDIRSSHRRI